MILAVRPVRLVLSLVWISLFANPGSPGFLWANGQNEPVNQPVQQNQIKAVLKILVPSSTSAIPFLWLADQDPLPGTDIQVEIFINHPKALAQLLIKEADLLFTGTTQGWSNYLDQGPIVMINTGIWGLSALVGKETNIRTFQDLKGKKIALPFPGAPLDFQTKYILEAYGIKESQVEFIYAPFTQAIPLLLNSQIDAAPLPEPLATEVVRNKGLKRLIDYRRAWAVVTKGDGSSPQVSLFATAALVHAERDLINRFVKAWEMATKEVQRQPQQLAEKYAQVLATSSGVLNEAIKNTLYLIPTTGENKRRIREYYLLMNRYYKTLSKDLGEDFFF